MRQKKCSFCCKDLAQLWQIFRFERKQCRRVWVGVGRMCNNGGMVLDNFWLIVDMVDDGYSRVL